ncbi:MAG TPA: HEAT repeat domain-containing protein [Pyrinomonadaceae bacterium]|nr:HEAT repeat domain-containing protein [Pyrinomonadaceae bacterium]
MNKVKLAHHTAASEAHAAQETATHQALSPSRCVRLGLVTALGVGLTFWSPDAPHAQQRRVREPGVKVTRIATSSRGKDSVVSISGDGNLNRAQTFQENGKFHVVLPYAKTELPNGAPRGVKMQRVGDSLEIIVPVKPGASVTVKPNFSNLDLVVSGGVDEATAEPQQQAKPETEAARQTRASAQQARQQAARERATTPRETQQGRLEQRASRHESAQPSSARAEDMPAQTPHAAPPHDPNAATTAQPIAPPVVETAAAPAATQQQPQVAAVAAAQTGGESSSFLFSMTGLLVVVGGLVTGALLLLLFRRRRRSEEDADLMSSEAEDVKEAKAERQREKAERKRRKAEAKREKKKASVVESVEMPTEEPFESYKGDRRKQSVSVAHDRRKGGGELLTHQVQNGALVPEGGADKSERKAEVVRAASASAPAVLFGAYRIDQEVTKLVQGEAHSIDVLASRATDDRRAIETSLVKVLQSEESSEDGKRRARGALEEYGFVARQSAALLLAPDAYERATAARVLGQVRAASSLPFLLEALYDTEQVVRTEVVTSLGALALPKAIGALLDMARRYPEIPASLLGNVLTACSVESLELSFADPQDSRTFAQSGEDFTGEIIGLDSVGVIEQLPEWLEDDTLADALERLVSVDVEARISAAQSLAQFQVRRSVEALAAMARYDEDAAVRAAAVTSLGHIDHESVFAFILLAMADEAREVRAAAARALTSLNIERADAYVRLMESADAETLRDVAQACLKTGLGAQAVNRLASEDRRQAYESFSLLSLLVRAGETRLVLEAVEKHADTNVRLAAIRLLGQMGDAEVVEQLRELATHGGVPEKVRASILAAVHHTADLQETV